MKKITILLLLLIPVIFSYSCGGEPAAVSPTPNAVVIPTPLQGGDASPASSTPPASAAPTASPKPGGNGSEFGKAADELISNPSVIPLSDLLEGAVTFEGKHIFSLKNGVLLATAETDTHELRVVLGYEKTRGSFSWSLLGFETEYGFVGAGDTASVDVETAEAIISDLAEKPELIPIASPYGSYAFIKDTISILGGSVVQALAESYGEEIELFFGYKVDDGNILWQLYGYDIGDGFSLPEG